ncbi:MAG: GNAT family N-acetyltransferase [Flavobacteriaceae bacterium]
MNALKLRFAEANDMSAVLALIQELADFEKEPNAVVITEEELRQDGFGRSPKFQCIVAEKGEKVIGMALFYPRYSTWKGATLHLEDLIVTQSERGTGAGKALYTAFIKYAAAQKVRRIEWVVLDWNTHAVDFYKESGATILDDWCIAQMDEKAMQDYLARTK